MKKFEEFLTEARVKDESGYATTKEAKENFQKQIDSYEKIVKSLTDEDHEIKIKMEE